MHNYFLGVHPTTNQSSHLRGQLPKPSEAQLQIVHNITKLIFKGKTKLKQHYSWSLDSNVVES